MLTPTEKIWHNGRFIRWEDATIHVLSHVVSYGSSVFEGIRCYATPAGPAVFRLREHVRRMIDSAKIYRMENLGFSAEQLGEAMLELVRVNKMDACYIRPIVLRGYGDIGVNPLKNPDRRLHRLLGVGQVSGRRSAGRRRGRLRVELEPHGARTPCPRSPRPAPIT